MSKTSFNKRLEHGESLKWPGIYVPEWSRDEWFLPKGHAINAMDVVTKSWKTVTNFLNIATNFLKTIQEHCYEIFFFCGSMAHPLTRL